jgi:nitronate monooxygenase
MLQSAMYDGAMSPTEVCALLNTLLEAERAGARVIAAYLEDPSWSAALRPGLARIQQDEARNCAVLMKLVRRMGGEASRNTGGFYQAALWIEGPRARLEFLNRGQAWVARRLAAAVPRIAEHDVRRSLEDMHESHIANIGACESLLQDLSRVDHASKDA